MTLQCVTGKRTLSEGYQFYLLNTSCEKQLYDLTAIRKIEPSTHSCIYIFTQLTHSHFPQSTPTRVLQSTVPWTSFYHHHHSFPFSNHRRRYRRWLFSKNSNHLLRTPSERPVSGHTHISHRHLLSSERSWLWPPMQPFHRAEGGAVALSMVKRNTADPVEALRRRLRQRQRRQSPSRRSCKWNTWGSFAEHKRP